MRPFLLFVMALLFGVAACGADPGGEEENGGDGAATTRAETTQPEPDDGESDQITPSTEADDDEGSPDDGDSEDSGPSTATVTLGDDLYTFSTEGAVVAQCLTDLFGIFSVQLPEVDGDGSLAIVALREGTDPDVVGEVDSVQLDVGDETWVADEADDLFDQFDRLEPGMSQVDSVEIDGRTVRGTATFFRQNSLFGGGDVETLTGAFEATCGEERTS